VGALVACSPEELLTAAEQFLRLPEVGAGPERIAQVRAQIARTGTYRHTTHELTIGCRLAWRNHAGCADRMGWTKLDVLDRRDLRTADEIFQACQQHLDESVNTGRIRPRITVFAPDAPGQPGPVIWNAQLVRYAGYRLAGSDQVLGDPISTAMTAAALRLGWPGGRLVDDGDGLQRADRGEYDVLPLVIQTHEEGPRWFELPMHWVREVIVRHPRLRLVERLGMLWYAAPVISDMALVIGGVTYPAAPFGGWYQLWEIAEDLGVRYGKLPELAELLGLDMTDPLWLDEALLELMRAIQHSYRDDNIMVDHHHRMARKHHQLAARMRAAGQQLPADPDVAVPPVAECVTKTFRDNHVPLQVWPNFVRRAQAPYPSAVDPIEVST
jgi:nitric-oxide synthase